MAEKLKILIVDDETVFAMLMKRNLSLLGYSVTDFVSTGKAAIAASQNQQPDVVLMDIGLAGEMDGIETAHQIKSVCNAEIIFVTGYSDDVLNERLKDLAPVACLVKPVGPNQLIPHLDSISANR